MTKTPSFIYPIKINVCLLPPSFGYSFVSPQNTFLSWVLGHVFRSNRMHDWTLDLQVLEEEKEEGGEGEEAVPSEVFEK